MSLTPGHRSTELPWHPATSLAHVSPQRIPPRLQERGHSAAFFHSPPSCHRPQVHIIRVPRETPSQSDGSLGPSGSCPLRHSQPVCWLLGVSLLAQLATPPEIPVSPTHQHATDVDHHVQISMWVSEQSRTHRTSDNAQFPRCIAVQLLLPSLRSIVSPLLWTSSACVLDDVCAWLSCSAAPQVQVADADHNDYDDRLL